MLPASKPCNVRGALVSEHHGAQAHFYARVVCLKVVGWSAPMPEKRRTFLRHGTVHYPSTSSALAMDELFEKADLDFGGSCSKTNSSG